MKINKYRQIFIALVALTFISCGGNTENSVNTEDNESNTSIQIKTKKAIYEPNSNVTVIISGKLSKNKEDKDWIGIFRKGVEKKWNNHIAWSFTKGNKTVSINTNNSLPTGEYVVALFLKNSLNEVETSSGFKVENTNKPFSNYGKKGKYKVDEIGYKETNDYFAYYPKGHIENAPIVIVSGYNSVHGYSGLMMYLASQGCYVIGHADRDGQRWSDVKFRRDDFIIAINDAKKLGADSSRLAAMGSSTGGMVSYYLMKYFKNEGYGTNKSFVIDIEGWYAQNMSRDDLTTLNVDSLILQIGGDSATPQYIYRNGVKKGPQDQDPRTLLTLSNLLPSKNKSYIVLNTDNHTYAKNDTEGKSNAYYVQDIIDNKHDLLGPIDAMVQYEFFNDNGQHNDAKSMLFDKKVYYNTRKRVYDATMKLINKGDKYTYGCSNVYNISYCTEHGIQ